MPAVGVISVNPRIEKLLAQFLFVVATKPDPQEIYRLIFQAFEILFAPARIKQHRAQNSVVTVEVFHVSRPLENRHFLIHLSVYRGGHRKESLDDFVIGHVFAAALAQYGGGQSSKSLLAGRVASRACMKQDPKRDQRTPVLDLKNRWFRLQDRRSAKQKQRENQEQ